MTSFVTAPQRSGFVGTFNDFISNRMVVVVTPLLTPYIFNMIVVFGTFLLAAEDDFVFEFVLFFDFEGHGQADSILFLGCTRRISWHVDRLDFGFLG